MPDYFFRKLLLGTIGIGLSIFLGLILISISSITRFSMAPVPRPVPVSQLIAEISVGSATTALFVLSLVTVIKTLKRDWDRRENR